VAGSWPYKKTSGLQNFILFLALFLFCSPCAIKNNLLISRARNAQIVHRTKEEEIVSERATARPKYAQVLEKVCSPRLATDGTRWTTEKGES
jgi:hypothetical protein